MQDNSIASNKQDLIAMLQEIREKYQLLPNTSNRDYDQFYATEESSYNKFEIALANNDLQDKSIVMLGDDDLVSVVAGIYFTEIQKDSSYKEILVIDIDDKILKKIQQIVEDYNLANIKTLKHDIRLKLPPQYINKYDTIITDPPYTKWGIKLFLNTALELLKRNSSNFETTIYLYFGASINEPFKFTKIQEILTSYSLVIQEKLNNFTQYNGAESIGSNSSLYILKPTGKSLTTNEYMGQEIYTFENSHDEKFPYVDHVTAKVYDVPEPFFTKGKLQKEIGRFCKTHKLKVVDTVMSTFKGNGITLTLVLANSNLVVHTWPEKNAIHIDLITCEPIHMKNEIINTLADIFQTKYINVNVIE